jgi:hypothetical protein
MVLPLPPALQSMEEFKTRTSFLTGATGFDAGAFESESMDDKDLEMTWMQAQAMQREHMDNYSPISSHDEALNQVPEKYANPAWSYNSTVSFDSMDSLSETEAKKLSGAPRGQDGRFRDLPASHLLPDVEKDKC